jgi:ABC-type amino acid transport substrate-binding protein
MQTGQYADVWAQLTGAPERLARFDTPAKPVMAFSQRLWVRKDDPLTAIANIGDLQGKLIGRLTAGYLPKIMADNQSKFAFDPVGGEDAATQTVMKLGSGRIWGAYFVSAEVLQYAAAKEGKLDQFKALKIVGEVDSLPAYTAMWKGLDPSLKRRVLSANQQAAMTKAYDYPAMIEAFIKEAPSHRGR